MNNYKEDFIRIYKSNIHRDGSEEWHMGGFDSAVKGGERSLNRAWEKYPLGAFLHVADLLASNIDEVRE